ncbi:hypothetical protein HUW51_18835 [Adhaeribacter swui]|uniref:Thiamine pyrophosphate enzyme TPP-binding domain-containing protein n=1 Tax=Adhaeribacter swui TaxID=2086471 RepID=A0A7G7GBZ8_9BACT|nr:thiamine pyrophosphate-dependent enzyme [Adhaeribacter swui]QNF34682.1 hypothetical protein HUW51_18835 [Adhaeribacter swui]
MFAFVCEIVKILIFPLDENKHIEHGHTLQNIDFAKVAEGCGAEGYRCAKPNELAATLKKAFASKRPAVIEVSIDPKELPKAPDKVKA